MHPSSGVLKTVSATSGVRHGNGTVTSFLRGLIRTGMSESCGMSSGGISRTSPLCRECGVMEETSTHSLRESDALASLRHAYLGSFFLEPKDIQSISLGAIWSFRNALWLP